MSFSHNIHTDPPSNRRFHSGSGTMSFKTRKYHFSGRWSEDTHTQSCLMSLTTQIPDNPAANTAQCGDSSPLIKSNMGERSLMEAGSEWDDANICQRQSRLWISSWRQAIPQSPVWSFVTNSSEVGRLFCTPAGIFYDNASENHNCNATCCDRTVSNHARSVVHFSHMMLFVATELQLFFGLKLIPLLSPVLTDLH